MRDGKEVARDNPAAHQKSGWVLQKSERVLHRLVRTEANGIPGGFAGFGFVA
jgi:hypothetical protein